MGSYYDIDDILAEEEPASVVFRKPANGVGIDPSAEKNCVEQGSKVELPLWLAHELRQRDAVSVSVPACFDEKTRLEIQADPANVDLRSRSPYFYEFGCKMAPITGDTTLGYFLFFAFQSRYKEVLTKAHTAAHVAAPKVLSRLTNEEINLYEAAQSSASAFKKWRVGGSRFQPSSALGRKRRQTYRVCFCFRRRFRLSPPEPSSQVRSIFKKYSENGIMETDHLRRFLAEVQGEGDVSAEDALGIIDRINQQRHLNVFNHRRWIDLDGFFAFLIVDTNSPLPQKHKVHQDMNAPLAHYFIHTGHNSYLTGNQLSSDCSDVPIVNALKRGVRVIELDIWPNSTKDDVHVLHGRTLTTPVELIKCLRSIKEHAFVASEYPVVITLEDHLTTDLQAKVAQMVTETFGEMLFSPGPECLKEFPSPESLKRRIIISTKPPKEYLTAKDATEKGAVSKKGATSDEEAWGKEVPYLKGSVEDDDGKDDLLVAMDDDDDDDEDGSGCKSQKHSAPEYRRLIAIHAGKPTGGLDVCLRVESDKVRRLSLSEQQLEKAITTHGKFIVRFTQHNILRVYPKGVRINSSNYNPLIGWSHGAQMVAFNMQGHGRSLWIMQGMFKANGGCGYVKKPDFLLKSGFDPQAPLPVKTTLKVTIYLGEGWYYDFDHSHFDVYSPPDFYARVGIAGVPADAVMKKTKTLEDNWVPSWNEEFEFPLTMPELAILRIEVHEYDMSEKDDFAGQTCLPVWEIRRGIRSVPLHDRKGEKYNSVKLLMRFEFV